MLDWMEELLGIDVRCGFWYCHFAEGKKKEKNPNPIPLRSAFFCYFILLWLWTMYSSENPPNNSLVRTPQTTQLPKSSKDLEV